MHTKLYDGFRLKLDYSLLPNKRGPMFILFQEFAPPTHLKSCPYIFCFQQIKPLYARNLQYHVEKSTF